MAVLAAWNDGRVRSRTVPLAAALLLAAAPARGAESTCFADAKRVCAGIAPEEPGFLACLREHETELSPSCRDDLRRLDRRAAVLEDACGSDVLRVCRDVPRGEGRVLACLDRNAMILSPGCVQEVAIALEKVEVLSNACGADLEKHCRGVPRGDGRRFLCLASKERLLSQGCRDALRP